MFRHKDFSEHWISWIKAIFSSGHSLVLFEWCAWKTFQLQRGVRQGDLLSPLPFVLAADLLQTVINDVADKNELTHSLGPNLL